MQEKALCVPTWLGIRACRLLFCVALLAARSAVAQIYDPDPKHPWNLLHEALIARHSPEGERVDEDSLDVLRWDQTTFLRTEPSRSAGIAAAEAFLQQHSEQRISDPVRRAMLLRDLWAVFDSLANSPPRINLGAGARAESDDRLLCDRLAQIIQRLALTPDQITALPDNCAAAVGSGTLPEKYDENNPGPFLPPDLFDPKGPFVCLSRNPRDGAIAPLHVREIGARSALGIFISLPGGRAATLEFVRKLADFPWTLAEIRQDPQHRLLPQFPVGTQVLLVRRMLTIDSSGQLAATPITESIQYRVFRSIPQPGQPRTPIGDQQSVAEVRLSRTSLFAGQAGGLKAVEPGSPEYPVIYTAQGEDFLEARLRPQHALSQCIGCHSSAGSSSLGVINFSSLRPQFTESEFARQASLAIAAKHQRYDWGLLRGIMDSHRLAP